MAQGWHVGTPGPKCVHGKKNWPGANFNLFKMAAKILSGPLFCIEHPSHIHIAHAILPDSGHLDLVIGYACMVDNSLVEKQYGQMWLKKIKRPGTITKCSVLCHNEHAILHDSGHLVLVIRYIHGSQQSG